MLVFFVWFLFLVIDYFEVFYMMGCLSLSLAGQLKYAIWCRIYWRMNVIQQLEYKNIIILYIFYVGMKQPRSSSSVTSKQVSKKPLFPIFKQSRLANKVQQLYTTNKSQIYFNIKAIPLQIVSQRRFGQTIKIIINATDVTIIQNNKNYKGFINYHVGIDSIKEWVQVNLGEVFTHVRLKKIVDENGMDCFSHLISWEKLEEGDKKILLTINIKQIMRGTKKKQEICSINSLIEKNTKNKQIKLFIKNLLVKKQNKKNMEKMEIEQKLSSKRNNLTLKNKIYLRNNQELGLLEMKNTNQSLNGLSNNTINNGITGIIGIKSFRREIIDVNKLKDSKFTGKSEKQTSVGDHNVDQSSLMINNLQLKSSNINSLGMNSSNKRRSKFDSQPYFYQNCVIRTQISNKNISMNKFTNHSRKQKTSIQQSQFDSLPHNHTQQIIQCLQNKSQHQSQQQVQQDIKRTEQVQQSLAQGTFEEKGEESGKKNKKEESVQKGMGESSGTLYQSKYQ